MNTDGTLEIGDRVMLEREGDQKRYHAMTHGVVVYYDGKHDPKNPRIRWASGWATSVRVRKTPLRHMTVEEMKANPPPTLILRDMEVAPPKEETGCTFKNGDTDGCPTCPRRITALYMCGLLQEAAKECQEEPDEVAPDSPRIYGDPVCCPFCQSLAALKLVNHITTVVTSNEVSPGDKYESIDLNEYQCHDKCEGRSFWV